MSYFGDLSEYQYLPSEAGRRCLNVGWLELARAFPTEQPSEEFLDRLWNHVTIIVNATRGLHDCEFCAAPVVSFVRNTTRLILGSGEIRVFSSEGAVFAAPNLIYHYVAEHNYRPPSEFVRAVIEGPHPSTDLYRRLLESCAVPWRENPPVEAEPKPLQW